MQANIPPSLFGIQSSNLNFNKVGHWGKNKFNSSFPAALAAYMASKGLENIYLVIDNDLKIKHTHISTRDLFGLPFDSNNLHYSFEDYFTAYRPLVIGKLPRVDLVTTEKNTGNSLKPLEIKLTALPDNSTCALSEDKYGCEIVVRPDTIVYLACSIADKFKSNLPALQSLMGDKFDDIGDWSEGENLLPLLPEMFAVIDQISKAIIDVQEPLLMQPIWKTEGKSPSLAFNCLDIFVWSNLALIRLFADVARAEGSTRKITRQVRSVIWLIKMLLEFSKNSQFDHKKVIDTLTFNTKNDKAFAIDGRITQPFMVCPQLLQPRITKNQLKEIILGGGHNLLSPERRFDAIIFNSPDLFI
ncbi:MAG: HindVP family restriction endonuclease [Saprospiraceae bacterium]